MTEHTDATRGEGPRPIDLAAPVSARVDLKGIALFECEVRRDRGVNLSRESLRMAVGIPDVTLQAEPERGQVVITLAFSLKAVREGETDAEPVLLIEAAFDLTYGLAKFEGLEEANFLAFARTNGVFNAWPYWRELVQNLIARMGFRPIILPLFRVQD
jgi:hypothetical protein